jgi:hypothetical protein
VQLKAAEDTKKTASDDGRAGDMTLKDTEEAEQETVTADTQLCQLLQWKPAVVQQRKEMAAEQQSSVDKREQ